MKAAALENLTHNQGERVASVTSVVFNSTSVTQLGEKARGKPPSAAWFRGPIRAGSFYKNKKQCIRVKLHFMKKNRKKKKKNLKNKLCLLGKKQKIDKWKKKKKRK